MSEPTARPWVYEEGGIFDADGNAIAYMEFEPEGAWTAEEQKALDASWKAQHDKAALIVAAVNAYPALEEAAKALEECVDALDGLWNAYLHKSIIGCEMWGKFCAPVIGEARAALSRIRETGGA